MMPIVFPCHNVIMAGESCTGPFEQIFVFIVFTYNSTEHIHAGFHSSLLSLPLTIAKLTSSKIPYFTRTDSDGPDSVQEYNGMFTGIYLRVLYLQALHRVLDRCTARCRFSIDNSFDCTYMIDDNKFRRR